jgi:hypothetical protein
MSRLGVIMRAIGKAVGIDADDLKVIAVVFVVVLVVGLVVILLAGAAGIAVTVFDKVSGF